MKSSLVSVAAAALLLAGCAHQPVLVSPKIAILNDQIKNNPTDAQAYSNRGYSLAVLGQKEAARADLQMAVRLKNNGPMHNGAGWAYFNIGDYKTALREWQIAADMSKRNARYDYYSLALGYWGVGDTKQALENYQLAVEREPRFGAIKTLQERTAEWSPRERFAIESLYTMWSKAWRSQ